jgi:hypothetical protein
VRHLLLIADCAIRHVALLFGQFLAAQVFEHSRSLLYIVVILRGVVNGGHLKGCRNESATGRAAGPLLMGIPDLSGCDVMDDSR